MDLEKAKSFHTEWKFNFREAIVLRASVDVASIQKDDCCDLGQWLSGEGRLRHAGKPDFEALISKHKKFHEEAGFVAATINAKQFGLAVKMIAPGTSFAKTSDEVEACIDRLKGLMDR